MTLEVAVVYCSGTYHNSIRVSGEQKIDISPVSPIFSPVRHGDCGGNIRSHQT